MGFQLFRALDALPAIGDPTTSDHGTAWNSYAPNSQAVAADLNRDGWVNNQDLDLLIAGWGEGCGYDPGLPQSCRDGRQNGDETDVDCGGSCGSSCSDDQRCADDPDCANNACVEGTCGLDICRCQPNKCGDCSNRVQACEAMGECVELVACVFENGCRFPHESCAGGVSCNALVGVAQSSLAGQAANNVLSCLGGCSAQAVNSCDNRVLDGDETGVDCGGSCGPCANGMACSTDDDCATGRCDLFICRSSPVSACDCNPEKCTDCSAQVATCEGTAGCLDLVACTQRSPYCRFPNEMCEDGQSCHDLMGIEQSSQAGQAANNLISCLGGCGS